MITNNGKLTDVIIEEILSDPTDPKIPLYLVVWADPELNDVIAKVEGVITIYVQDCVRYSVYLDPRYDINWIKAEIEAAIKCKKEYSNNQDWIDSWLCEFFDKDDTG